MTTPDIPQEQQPTTPMVAPLAEAEDLNDLLDDDGRIKDSPANAEADAEQDGD